MTIERFVLTRQEGRVRTLTLNRPAARNALNRELLTDLQAELDAAAHDPDVGVIVLTGNGPAFCAGADLKEAALNMEGDGFLDGYERTTQSMRIHQALPRLPKPVIAAVNGFALAGGCGMAMSCDLVFAAESARFGYPEANRGHVAAMVMVSLSRIVGRRQALELLLSGRLITAAESLDFGMINWIVPDDELMPRVMRYAQDMAAKPASGLRFTKDLYRQVQEIDYDRALEYARDFNLMFRKSNDARAGAQRFVAGEERERAT